MATITSILNRISELTGRNGKNSIGKTDLFGLLTDMVKRQQSTELNMSNLSLRKIYASVAAMNADVAAPVGDDGEKILKGQLVVISAVGADMGKVYRYSGDDAWEYIGQIGDLSQKADKAILDSVIEIKSSKDSVIEANKQGLLIPISQTSHSKTDPINKGIYSKSIISVHPQLTEKYINRISVPIVKNFTENKNFTDGILVKVGKNDKYIYSKQIPFSEVATYNSRLIGDNHSLFDYNIEIPLTHFAIGDNLYIAVEVMSRNDKIGTTFAGTDVTLEGGSGIGKAYGEINYKVRDSTTPETVVEEFGGCIGTLYFYDRYVLKESDLQNFANKAFNASAHLILNSNRQDFGIVTAIIDPIGKNCWNGNDFDHRTAENWYYGISPKIINQIGIPLVRRFYSSLSFTDSIYVRLAINGMWQFHHEVTLAELNESGINSTTSSSSLDSFYYNIQLPIITINPGDVVYIGVTCKSQADKMGFFYSSDNSGEWSNRYYLRSDNAIDDYIDVPTPSGDQSYTYCVMFSYVDYIAGQIKYGSRGIISINSRNINTFIGSQNHVIDMLLAAKPRARFAFISHHTEDGILGNRSCESLIRAQIELAKYWGVPILNLAEKLGWIKKNGINTLISNVPDEIHPGTDSTFESISQIKNLCIEFLKPLFPNWIGKKVVWYGTSIPYGHPVNDLSTRYPEQSVTELGGTCINQSFPGSTIRRNKYDGTALTMSFLDSAYARNFQTHMLDLIGTANEPDLFVFDFGINDWVSDESDFKFDTRI